MNDASQPKSCPPPLPYFTLDELLADAGAEPAPARPSPATEPAPAPRTLTLGHREALRVVASDGTPLFEIESSPQGPVVRLLQQDVDLNVAGRLRLAADRIELEARDGGLALGSSGNTVVRSRAIYLN